MKPRQPSKQQGQILWWLLLFSSLLAALSLPALSNNSSSLQRATQTQATLARAKEALIARAVADDNRPGSLPCPDRMTDNSALNNHPNDGRADLFTLTQCPSYLGWLPWATLDLPDPQDASGNRLWYALGPALRDDDSAQPINSETASGLWLDGNPEIAALLIAPGAPLAGQTRPSTQPTDFLESSNDQGEQRHYLTCPSGTDCNDRILAITRSELMAAVEKRIAGELRLCLNSHAASPANPGQRLPWPSPLAASNNQGQSGSLFGRIPASQPDSSLSTQLDELSQGLQARLDALNAANTPAQQLNELTALAEQLSASRNYFDNLFLVSNQLKQQADSASSQLQTLENTALSAAGDTRISRSEGTLIRSRADSASPALLNLQTTLTQYGLDSFPWQLQQLSERLASTPESTLTDIAALLAAASSPRNDFQLALDSARQNSNAAQTVFADPMQAANRPLAVQNLRQSLGDLSASITASRVNVPASDIVAHIRALREPIANSGPANAALTDAQSQLKQLSSGLPAIRQQRDASLSAINAAQATPEQTPQAIDSLQLLADALLANEAADNNLTRSSLNAAIPPYQTARDRFVAIDTATPRPVQRDIVPYAEDLANFAVNPVLLAKMIADHSASLAPPAKAQTLPTGSDPAQASPLDSSAYRLAEKSLLSIVDRNQTRDLLLAYQASPSSSRLNKANSALATTRQLSQQTLSAAAQIRPLLSASQGSALPMLWYSENCNFLRPGGLSWWQANQWQTRSFYQISSPWPGSPAKLQVNGQGGLRLVVILAGARLSGQTSSNDISQFFEADNADPSRNGDARQPLPGFVALPLSARFNDRLAW